MINPKDGMKVSFISVGSESYLTAQIKNKLNVNKKDKCLVGIPV